ncbi:MAG: tetratricopeptide repeat protein [Chloroflexota bacterium]|nr:tetratricopeptide repeat protein [Chloroflexota bacterium]
MIFAVLGLELWTFLFVGFFGSELLGAYPTLRIATQILFIVPLAVWAALRLRGPRNGLDWAIVAGLAALVVVSLTSADVRGSLETVGLAIVYALTFWGMREIGRMPRLRSAAAVAIGYALVFWMVMGAIWWIGEKVAWIQAFGTIPNLESSQVFIWGTANVFPVLSLLAIPALRWQPPGLGRRLLIGAWAVSSVVVIPLSAGRAGWLGLVVAAIAYDWLSGSAWVRGAAAWLWGRRLLAPAIGLAAVAAGAVGVVVATRFSGVVDSALDGRGEIWRQALAIFAADPLTGGGPSTYSWLRLQHVPDYTYPVVVRLAHSVPLLTLADGGLVLFLALVALVVAWARAARPFLADPARRTAIAVLVGFAAASLFDDYSSLPAVLAVVIIFAAWIVAPENGVQLPERTRRGAAPFVLPAAIAVLALVAIPSVVGVDAARAAASQGRDAAVRGDWGTAKERFEIAVANHVEDAGYWLGLGLARAELGDKAGARSAYNTARQLSPGDPRGWGAEAVLTTDPTEHIALLREAAKRTTSDPSYAFLLGNALEAAGRTDEATRAYAIAVAFGSDLIEQFPATPTPGGRPARQEVETAVRSFVDDVAARAAVSEQAVLWNLALSDDRLATDAGPAWRAVDLARNADAAGASAAAREAQAASPYDATTLAALMAVDRLTCDQAAFDRVAAWLGAYRPARPAALTIVREHVYREDALSSYLPPEAERLPADERWPWPFIGAPPACPGWQSAPSSP